MKGATCVLPRRPGTIAVVAAIGKKCIDGPDGPIQISSVGAFNAINLDETSVGRNGGRLGQTNLHITIIAGADADSVSHDDFG